MPVKHFERYSHIKKEMTESKIPNKKSKHAIAVMFA